jgi:hypothetical protein
LSGAAEVSTYSEAIAKTSPEDPQQQLMKASEFFEKLGAKRDLGKAEARLAAEA